MGKSSVKGNRRIKLFPMRTSEEIIPAPTKQTATSLVWKRTAISVELNLMNGRIHLSDAGNPFEMGNRVTLDPGAAEKLIADLKAAIAVSKLA